MGSPEEIVIVYDTNVQESETVGACPENEISDTTEPSGNPNDTDGQSLSDANVSKDSDGVGIAMGSPEQIVIVYDTNQQESETAGDCSENEIGDTTELSVNPNDTGLQSLSDANVPKESDGAGTAITKKFKKKFRYGKKGHLLSKDNIDRNVVRRLHHASTKSKQGRKRALSFPSISKFFLPHKRPPKEVFIPPTKFLLGGNISDPLNLNSLQDEDVNRAMNAVTPESSPLPTPPRHKGKIDVIIPPNIRDPLNLLDPLDNDEYEKQLEMQQRKPRKKARIRRRTTDNTSPISEIDVDVIEHIKEPPPPEPSTSACIKSRKRSCSDSDNASQKGKDPKKLRRMDSLDKIVSPVVPQPGAWMRARPQARGTQPERPVSPHRTKPKVKPEGEQKLPTFHPKNSRYQYGNYDR